MQKTLADFHEPDSTILKKQEIKDLLELYAKRESAIKARLHEFEEVWEASDGRIFEELCFCLLTANSSAELCIKAINKLRESNLLLRGSEEEIRRCLAECSYNYPGRAGYIVRTREYLQKELSFQVKRRIDSFQSAEEARDWLAESICGMGYKEASHFLRNIARGFELAILDKHVLRSLRHFGVIREVPNSIGKKQYLEIEAKMRSFSRAIGVPMGELDLLLWSRATGKILK